MTHRYFEEWDENTDIAWWKDCRTRLNVIIRAFNAWQHRAQVDGCYEARQAREILASIEEAKQTWASEERMGRSNYREELDAMKSILDEHAHEGRTP